MDKVIIDGVDVSECSYAITPKRQCPNKPMPYAKETSCISCKEHNTKLNFCKNNPDCYFKQLKRLQAEIFELKESLKVFQRPDITKILTLYKVGDIELLEQKCDRLQAENERLKEENYGLNQELLGYKKGVQASEIIELKQALQEIRDIADENKDTAQYRGICLSIIAKINEVIGAE